MFIYESNDPAEVIPAYPVAALQALAKVFFLSVCMAGDE